MAHDLEVLICRRFKSLNCVNRLLIEGHGEVHTISNFLWMTQLADFLMILSMHQGLVHTLHYELEACLLLAWRLDVTVKNLEVDGFGGERFRVVSDGWVGLKMSNICASESPSVMLCCLDCQFRVTDVVTVTVEFECFLVDVEFVQDRHLERFIPTCVSVS